jgi:hypothetical protein
VKRLRILLSGMVAGMPRQGGATWAVIQYVLGFRRLGHEVCLIEPVGRDALPDATPYFREVAREFRLEGSGALLEPGSRKTIGLSYDELRRRACSADLLVNVSGMLRDQELVRPAPVRLYLDLDPAFNQLWCAHGIDVGLGGHTHYATVGQAIGRGDCSVPTCGVEWIPTLPPVVLEHWPVAGRVEHDGMTTVGNWRAYGSVEHEGVRYGQKAHSLRPLRELPRLSGETFLLGIAIHPDERADLEMLAATGWVLLDAEAVAGTPGTYRRFVQGSRAEFGLVKEGYVVSRCGWFSDRSACYLASGRPVLAQDTGLGDALATGRGILTFSTLAEAVAGIEELRRDYPGHSRAARAFAEQHLDSDKVLGRLLEAVGVI